MICIKSLHPLVFKKIICTLFRDLLCIFMSFYTHKSLKMRPLTTLQCSRTTLFLQEQNDLWNVSQCMGPYLSNCLAISSLSSGISLPAYVFTVSCVIMVSFFCVCLYKEMEKILSDTPPVWRGSSKLFRNLRERGQWRHTLAPLDTNNLSLLYICCLLYCNNKSLLLSSIINFFLIKKHINRCLHHNVPFAFKIRY